MGKQVGQSGAKPALLMCPGPLLHLAARELIPICVTWLDCWVCKCPENHLLGEQELSDFQAEVEKLWEEQMEWSLVFAVKSDWHTSAVLCVSHGGFLAMTGGTISFAKSKRDAKGFFEEGQVTLLNRIYCWDSHCGRSSSYEFLGRISN